MACHDLPSASFAQGLVIIFLFIVKRSLLTVGLQLMALVYKMYWQTSCHFIAEDPSEIGELLLCYCLTWQAKQHWAIFCQCTHHLIYLKVNLCVIRSSRGKFFTYVHRTLH